MTDIKRIILDALEAYKRANPYTPTNQEGAVAYICYQHTVSEAIAWVKEAI